jgi:hypothetical protein
MGFLDFLREQDDEEQPLDQPLPTALSKPVEQDQAPQQPSSIENPMVKDYISKLYGDKFSDAARDKLKSQIADEASGPNFKAGLSALGAGLMGQNAAAAGEAVLDRQKAERDKKLTDFDAGRKALVGNQEMNMKLRDDAKAQEVMARESDPASEESKLAQQAALKMGVKPEIAAKLTAKTFKEQGPLYEKIYKVEQDRLKRQDELSKSKEERDERKNAKTTAEQDKALQSAQQLLESARGNPAAAQAEKDLYAAKKADSLANLYGDPAKLSMQQVRLLASEVGKIASGGTPSMHELEGITPSTLTGKLSEVVSKFTNEPTAANAAAFVKQYQDYTKQLAKDAKEVIRDKYGRVIESRRNQLGDVGYQMLKDNYLNRFDVEQELGGGGGETVRVVDPKGQVRLIPKNQLQDALKAGGKLAEI